MEGMKRDAKGKWVTSCQFTTITVLDEIEEVEK